MLREKNINAGDSEFEIQDFELDGQLLFDLPPETGIKVIENADSNPNSDNQTQSDKQSDKQSDNQTQSDEQTQSDTQSAQNSKKMAIIGYSVMVFALIGLLLLIKFGIGLMDNVDTDTTEERLLEFVSPMVIADIPPFESESEIDNEDLISLAIWNYILNSKNTSQSVVEVRQEEIELQTKYIFGYLIPLNNQTVSVGGSQFVYNAETKTYSVPLDVYFYSYYPKIKNIELNGNEYSVEVDYLRDTPRWVKNVPNSPVKTLTYTIDAVDKEYQLVSIK